LPRRVTERRLQNSAGFGPELKTLGLASIKQARGAVHYPPGPGALSTSPGPLFFSGAADSRDEPSTAWAA